MRVHQALIFSFKDNLVKDSKNVITKILGNINFFLNRWQTL